MGGAEWVGQRWDENSFFEELSKQKPEVIPVARAILEWGKKRCSYFWWGKGKQTGSFAPIFKHQGMECYPTFIWTTGTGDIQFQYLQNHRPFDQEEKRRELMQRLNAIPRISIPENALRRRPSFPLKALIPSSSLQMYIDVLNWILDEVVKND